MNIYIETYGCAVSKNEAEIIAGLLEKNGFELGKLEESEIIIIESCVVKAVTEQRLLDRIKFLTEKYPKKKIIIAGCAPEVLKEKILKINPKISLVGTHYTTEIAEAVKKLLAGERVEFLGKRKEVKLCMEKRNSNPVISIVPISSGCIGSCSFCLTRFVKGPLFSYPKEKILEEIKISLKAGCKEIWLTAQDTGAYGLDIEKKSQLPQLLSEIDKIKGKFKVRVGMMNPNNILPVLPELIESYKSEKIYKFLHLPVQSGDNLILKKMNRLYEVKDFEYIINEFRKAFPKICIWTDIIVGFPSETKEQFENTLDLLKKIRPDYVNVSRFAKRDGTPASCLKQLKTDEMKKRTKEISELARGIFLEKNREWIGWQGEVLLSEDKIGRNFCYKPVLIEKENFGEFVNVKIIDAVRNYLIGKNI